MYPSKPKHLIIWNGVLVYKLCDVSFLLAVTLQYDAISDFALVTLFLKYYGPVHVEYLLLILRAHH